MKARFSSIINAFTKIRMEKRLLNAAQINEVEAYVREQTNFKKEKKMYRHIRLFHAYSL
jgi:hypothetical protein